MYKPKVKAPSPEIIDKTQSILRQNALNSVCEAAACPNRAECYARHSATFMILGSTCTRACSFCNISTGKPLPPDPTEPARLAKAVKELDLAYVVITSVDRDDLPDYGASHFFKCVKAVKESNPHIKIELLTPDFKYDTQALDTIIQTGAHKLAHNQESIRRLSKSIRPQSSYEKSLKVLEYYAKYSDSIIKSSLMVGLGETRQELLETMQDLRDIGVEEITIGQYLQPSPSHHPVIKYYAPDFFEEIKQAAYDMGFRAVASGVLVRSSYYADQLGEKE